MHEPSSYCTKCGKVMQIKHLAPRKKFGQYTGKQYSRIFHICPNWCWWKFFFHDRYIAGFERLKIHNRSSTMQQLRSKARKIVDNHYLDDIAACKSDLEKY